MNIRIKYFLIVLFIVSCNTNNKQGNVLQVKNTPNATIGIDLDDQVPIRYSDFITEVDYITLNTPSEDFIAQATKLLINDSIIGIFDAPGNVIWIFDKSGNFKKKIEISEGRGPGEMITLNDAVLGKQNKIHVLGLLKLVTLNYDGEVVNEIKLPYALEKFEYLPKDDAFVLYMANSIVGEDGETQDVYNLIMIDKKGTILNKFIPVGKEKMGLSFIIPSNFYEANGQVHHFGFLDNNIYKVHGTDSVQVKYRINYEDITKPDYELRKKYQTDSNFIQEEIWGKDYPVFTSIHETEKYVYGSLLYNGRSQFLYNKDHDEVKFHEDIINDFFGMDVFLTGSNANYLYGAEHIDEIRNFLKGLNKQDYDYQNKEIQRLQEAIANSNKSNGFILIKAKAF